MEKNISQDPDYESKKRWRENNKEKVRKIQRDWRLNNPKKMQMSRDKWENNNKEKNRESKKEYYDKHKDYIRIKRNANPKIRENIKLWEKENKDKVKLAKKGWLNRNKEKRKAHLLSQRIKRKNKCEFCSGDYRLQKHHPDYNQPFYIITLCDKCHKDLHRIERRLKEENEKQKA